MQKSLVFFSNSNGSLTEYPAALTDQMAQTRDVDTL